eukprot:CAMPEP_0117431560 /NCGR_PEP_ID=MMETSP0758-20121206/11074_1 /TAXON_ID=63605 /ORGANISM="Percolomonas cosmopolitus, Strain AE-1 (ATCC 50343)" /LENGTH=561 /DNA_ID=CAMNT_0005220651 /DNA_START=103 /DNA_END=1785 /DNA_ORIENTATION=-
MTRNFKEGEYDTGYYQQSMTGPRVKRKVNRAKTKDGYDKFDKLRKRESVSETDYEEFTTFSRDQLIKQHKSSDEAIPYDDVDEVDKKIENAPKDFKAVGEFEQVQFHPFLSQTLKDLKMNRPTPIQQMTLGLGEHDVIATSETGSGKTFAFLLPIVQSLFKHGKRNQAQTVPMPVRALIIQPTRELCNQVYREALKLTLGSNIKVNMAFGSVSVSAQEKQILKGTDILIATPGRMNHFLEHGVFSVDQVDHLVIDEADQLMDMGFFPQLKTLIHPLLNINKNRTTQLYSATFDSKIVKFANEFLRKNHARVTIGRVGQTTKNVTQNFEIFEGSFYDKVQTLSYVLKRNPGKTVVFCKTKSVCERLVLLLEHLNMDMIYIHGNIGQATRQRAINKFSSKMKPNDRQRVLIATDLVARGIDIRDISHVINFDLPDTFDKYVHRIGRTGRMGDKGTATTLVNVSRSEPNEIVVLNEIRKEFADNNEKVPENLKKATNFGPRKLSITRRVGKKADKTFEYYENLPNKNQKRAFKKKLSESYNFDEFEKSKNSHHQPRTKDNRYRR